MAAMNGHIKEKRGPFDYKNVFKSRIWTYLRMYPNLSFAEYQKKAADKQCQEWAFDDVKKDISVFGEWNGKEIVPRASLVNMSSTPPPEPKPLPTPVEPPVAHQIALPDPPDKRIKLDQTLKAMALEIIIKTPLITYDELQAQMNWPELDKQNFYTLRYRLKTEGKIPKGEGRVVSPDTKVCRQNLARLGFKALTGMNHEQYLEKYSHQVKPSIFRSIRSSELKAKAPVPEVVAQPTGQVVVAWESWAELDLSEFKVEDHSKVRKCFQSYFEKRRPDVMRAGKIKLSVMSDPPVLEIRKAVSIIR